MLAPTLSLSRRKVEGFFSRRSRSAFQKAGTSFIKGDSMCITGISCAALARVDALTGGDAEAWILAKLRQIEGLDVLPTSRKQPGVAPADAQFTISRGFQAAVDENGLSLPS